MASRRAGVIALCIGVCALLSWDGLAGARGGRIAQAPSADYGGGAISTKYSTRDTGGVEVTLRPVAGGRMAVFARTYAHCGHSPGMRGGLTAYFAVDTTGAMAGSDVASTGPRRRRRTDRLSFSGRIEGARASGFMRVRITQRRPGKSTVHCHSGTVAWQARAASVPPGEPPARPPAGAAFFGTTATRLPGYAAFPALLRVSADGSRVEVGLIGVLERCRRGGHRAPLYNYNDYVPGAPIAADGTFRSEETFSQFAGHREHVVVSGRFTSTGVSGTYHAHTLFRARHRAVERCDSGEVPWSAVP
jgi:hypothetical protein